MINMAMLPIKDLKRKSNLNNKTIYKVNNVHNCKILTSLQKKMFGFQDLTNTVN